MKYINTKTKAVIETACVIHSDNWKVLDDTKKEKQSKKAKK